jgi:hypothetical protein
MATIVIEIPEELKRMVPALRDALDTAMTQVERAQLGDAVAYAAFEQAISEKLCEVERRAHEAALTALDANLPRLMINKVAHMRVLEDIETTFMTQAGPVKVTRSLYRPVGERNGPVVDLVALRAGAVEGVWLPATAREMAFDVQQVTSREAETNGQRKGRVPYSHSSFEHVAHAVGEMYVQQHEPIEQVLIEHFEVPDEAFTVTASLDRVSVPMEEPLEQEPEVLQDSEVSLKEAEKTDADAPKRKIQRAFRMAYCGTVTLHHADGEALHTIRYGTMPGGDPAGLCTGIAGDVVALLAQRPDLRVGLLCDGAPEMWNLLDAEFTEAPFDTKEIVVVRLIDFWHAVEKLAPAAKVLAGDEAAAKPMLARWKLLLRNSSSARTRILRELVDSGKEDVDVGSSKPVHEAITYFTNNAKRMNYAAARRNGLPIGSGNVEATCKSLVDVRMKRPGSRWKNRTGEHVIHMRALALSDRWDDAMDIVFKPPRVRVRPLAA